MENKNVIWKPQPRQAEFQRRSEYEVLYGGAAGGGKSDALVAEALRQVHISHYKGIIFRKTYPQLRELILKSKRIYKKAFPGAKYNSTEHVWTFPSGAMIYFGNMPHADSYLNYQGLSFAFIGFDELTHFTQEEYEYLFSRNRADGPGVRVYIRATTNPGGIGHGWVKERFITPAKPGTPITFETEVLMPDGSKMKVERKRIFIPASVYDNQELLKNDPNYIANLAMLPDAKRRALLYGDWDSFSGQVFTEWKDNPDGYINRKWTHVIEPFEIPPEWRRYRSFDWGFAKPFAVQWWAVSPDGTVFLYRQLYGCTDTPNEGVKWSMDKVAKEIREIEKEERTLEPIIGVADPSIWDESRGYGGSIIAAMERQGVYFEKGDNTRIAGKMQVHYRLAFSDDGYPKLYVFNTCRHFIRTLPNLVYDTVRCEDIDTSLEDHDYDAMRYFLMLQPIPARENKGGVKTKAFSPLDL